MSDTCAIATRSLGKSGIDVTEIGIGLWAQGGHWGPVDDEALQSVVYAVGRDKFDPLRGWFTALYEVLLGASQGPRFGGFIALYGVDETIALIDKALAGDLA